MVGTRITGAALRERRGLGLPLSGPAEVCGLGRPHQGRAARVAARPPAAALDPAARARIGWLFRKGGGAVGASRWVPEHEIGWTLDQVADVFSRAEDIDDDLAMVELEVTAMRDSVIACHTACVDEVGHCAERDRDGDRLRQFDSGLSDDPFGQATAVQRT